MKFLIGNTEFNYNLNISDKLYIKSLNKDYIVNYSNKNLDELINDIYNKNDIIFIDRNVYNLSSQLLFENNIYIYDAIEENKNIENVMKLIDYLILKKITKKNKLIVIGGGITQEIGGFAAAIFKRGIKWVLIPTTILCMTDSCIGSKVSLNHKSKNMVGLFAAPNEIYISDYFLKSLKKDDIISGVGEALKLSLIGGKESYKLFKNSLEKNDYITIIKLASIIKKEIIEYDEFEEYERKSLNYGHTIGHALESVTNYYIPHGIAVLIGMYIKNILFYNDKYDNINNLILRLIDNKFFEIEFSYDTFLEYILSDKKNDGDNICLILLDDLGHTIITYKKIDEFKYSLELIIKKIFKSRKII